jgi:hypothetical protein
MAAKSVEMSLDAAASKTPLRTLDLVHSRKASTRVFLARRAGMDRYENSPTSPLRLIG